MYRRWDKSKPPSGPFCLNKDSWRAQGLVHWFPMGAGSLAQQYDFASGMVLTGTSIAGYTRGAAGEPVVTTNGTTSVYAKTGGVSITAAPLMVGMWVRPTDVTTNRIMYSSGQFAFGGNNRWQFDVNAGNLRWLAATGSVGVASVSAGSVNVWHHYLGVEISSSSRYAQADGVAGTQDTTASTPSSVDSLNIGANESSSTYSSFIAADFGEVCIWNQTMDANMRAALADFGTRFDLWYPLRSRKWLSAGGGIASRTYTPSGGVAFSGGTSPIRGRVVTPSGGVSMAGAALAIRGRVYTPSGGVAFSGAATYQTASPTRTYTPEGGVVLGGSADYQTTGTAVVRDLGARRLPKPIKRPPLKLPWADDERPVKTALERPDPSERAALPAARIESAPSVAAAVAATNVVDAMDDDLPYVAAMILLLDEDDDDNTLQA